jgi:hypothetical protein
MRMQKPHSTQFSRHEGASIARMRGCVHILRACPCAAYTRYLTCLIPKADSPMSVKMLVGSAVMLLGVIGQVIGSVHDALCHTPTVTIREGVIVGTTTAIHGATMAVNKFLGIPFAAAPIGKARFSPPKPTSWVEPIDTKVFGPSCIQVFSLWHVLRTMKIF